MNVKNPIIQELLNYYKEISLLGKIKAVLEWDLNVNLPQKGAEGRSNQIAYLSELIIKLWQDKEFTQNLKKAQKISEKLSLEEKAVIRNLDLSSKYYLKVPKEIISKKDQESAKGYMAWKDAKIKNDFSIFLPYLKEIIRLDQEIAKYLEFKENPYDALLELYEPGLTAKKVELAFNEIKPSLIYLLKKIQENKNYNSNKLFKDSKFSSIQQELLSKELMKMAGFDFDSGRVDVSPHPFTMGIDLFDVRITTIYKELDPLFSYTSTMHETGHALYNLGINPAYLDTPLFGGASYGIHEALSRFWENFVGKNPKFIKYMFPKFKEYFSTQFKGIDVKSFIKELNLVKPSLIRIEADELTYNLHIILRFEMENDLINNRISVEDAPKIWREKSKEYFGIIPENDSIGILQDVHWSTGSFGYFPAYALGNLYGAQILNSMKKDINFDSEIEKGNLLPIKNWLDKNVHAYGSLYLPDELIQKVTGEKLNPKYFIEYLNSKFGSIYDLK